MRTRWFPEWFPFYRTWYWPWGQPFLPFTGDTLFVGRRRQGKSVLAAMLCFEDPALGVLTKNTELNWPVFNALRRKRGLPEKTGERVAEVADFYNAHCWFRWHDEAQLDYPARGYKDADKKGLNAITEQGKDDAATVYTVQALRNLDVLVAGACDSVALVSRRSIPLVGWFWPRCVRPPMKCRHLEHDPDDECMRSGVGDQYDLFHKVLGYGTILNWSCVDPELFNKKRTMDGSAQIEKGPEDEDPAVLWSGWVPFDIEIAQCFDSGQKAHDEAPAAAPAPKVLGAAPPPEPDDIGQLTLDALEREPPGQRPIGRSGHKQFTGQI